MAKKVTTSRNSNSSVSSEKKWNERKVKIRHGVRPPWFEILLTSKDGKMVKLVAKVVPSFLSDEWQGGKDGVL